MKSVTRSLFDGIGANTSVVLIALVAMFAIAGCGGGSGGGGIFSVGTAISGNVGSGGSPVIFAPSLPPGSVESTPGAGIANATVEVIDADGNVVATTTTDANGDYTVTVPNGTYQIGIRVGSVDNFTPLRSSVIVRGADVDGTSDVGGDPTLDFEVPNATAASVTGTITNANTAAPIQGVIIEFIDAESGLVRYQTTTDVAGNYSVSVLPVGSFRVVVDAETVPSGLIPPSPRALSITAASGAIVQDFAVVTATSVSGAVTTTPGVAPIPGAGPEGLLVPPVLIEAELTVEDGAEVIIEEVGYGEIARFELDTAGGFDLDLRDGSYIVTFVGFGDDTVAPPPMRITVKDGLIYTDGADAPIDPAASETLASTAADVSATLIGSVTRAAEGVLTRVVARDPSTGAILKKADTDDDGNYSLALSDGSYNISIEQSLLPSGVIPPKTVRVTVEAGADPVVPIKENSATADDGIVDFILNTASINLSGFVFDTDDPTSLFQDVRVIARKGGEVVARAVTDSLGAYTLRLPVGTIDLSVNPDTVPAGMLPPEKLRVEVSLNGGVAEITDNDGLVTSLNFELEARNPNVTGTVTFDFDGDTIIAADEVVGCRVFVIKPNGEKVLFSTPTDPATGGYSLTLPNGAYKIALDPEGLPPGSAAPAPIRVSVTDTGVTLPDGTVAASVNADFRLVRRARTLEGMVTLAGRGVTVKLKLVDLATGRVVNQASSAALTGAYRMGLFQGSYELRVDPTTLPSGVAIPNSAIISVAADGTVNTDLASNVAALNFFLTRNVVELSGTVSVERGAETLPAEVVVLIRDPQDHSVLFDTRSDAETGDYSVLLLAGSWEIAIDSGELPPGVLPPSPVVVTVSGSTIDGEGVTGNLLDFALADTRSGGVEISGYVFDAGGTNAPAEAELRLFDPASGSSTENFILSTACDENGFYQFTATEGTYKLAVLPESLPPTAIAPKAVTFSIQGATSIENNVLDDPSANGNVANDETINFSFQDAANQGIRVVGVVTDPATDPIPSVIVMARNASTGEIVVEAATDFTGAYSMLLPLGSYSLQIDPFSLPFDPDNAANNLLAPDSVSVLAQDNGGIVVSTNGGTAVAANIDGDYEFDFEAIAASQTLSGSVVDSASNLVRVYVEIRKGQSGDLVTGRFSEAGLFEFQLPPGNYKARVASGSVPVNQIAPKAIEFTVTASAILEESGTEDDGTIAFTLLSGAQTVSGTVLDDTSAAIGCFVEAYDALTDEFVKGKQTVASTGNYTLQLPVGTYVLGVAPSSLPDGYIAPNPVTVQVESGVDATGQDFEVTIATEVLSGDVLNDSSIVIPAIVVLVRASTNTFVAEASTDPDTGAWSIVAPPGSYRLKIDPDSLPDGSVTPAGVLVQVTAAGATLEANTTGAGNLEDDGIINFRVAEAASLLTLTGSVTLDGPSGSEALSVYISVEDAGDDSFVNGDTSDAANNGDYSINLGDGTYRVLVDADTLPPGVTNPAPVLVSVNTTDLTITQTVGGVAVESTVLDFALELNENDISGSVTLVDAFDVAISGFACSIKVVDRNSTNNFVVHEGPTDVNGDFDFSVPDGSYRVSIKSSSLPDGTISSGAINVTTTGGIIVEQSGTANDGVLEFTVTETVTTLTGIVEDSDGDDLFAYVEIVDIATDDVVAGVDAEGADGFSIELLDGTYDILVDPPSLPSNTVAPIPTRITVDATLTPPISIVTAGSGTLTGTDLTIVATLKASATTFDVQIQDNETPNNSLGGLVLIKDTAGNIVEFVDVPDSGTEEVSLGDGTYTVEVDEFSVPPGYSVPDAVSIDVSGASVTYTSDASNADPTIITVTESVLIGTIYGAVDTVPNPDETLVVLQLLDGEGTVLNASVPLTQSGTDATYSTTLGEGTFKLRLIRAAGVTGADVLLPKPVSVSVVDGIIQNNDDDVSTSAVDVDLELPSIDATVSGSVTLDAVAIGSGLLIVARNPVDGTNINEALTDSSGDFSLALPSGLFEIVVDTTSLATLYPTALYPALYEVDVLSDGTVTEYTVGAADNALDFPLITFDPLIDAVIRGLIETQESDADTPVAADGAKVLLLGSDGVPIASAITASDGTYELYPGDGTGQVVVEFFDLDVGYALLPPIPVQVNVLGTSVTESNTLGFDPDDGAVANDLDDGIVNIILEGASVLLQGTVQDGNGDGVGAGIIITDASRTKIPEFVFTYFTGPDGDYIIPIGDGAHKLWIDPFSLPPGYVAPSPINFTVDGSNVTESNTAGEDNVANDGIINPVLGSGGAVVYGRLVDDTAAGFSAWVGLFKEAASPTEPPFFITNTQSDSTSGDFSLDTGNGSFFLEVDPFSLPPDQQSPARVYLSVDDGVVSFAAGTTTVSDIDGTETGALMQTELANTDLRGTVTDDLGDGVSCVVVVLDSANDTFVTDALTDATTGRYDVTLGDGLYKFVVDPFSLPEGSVAPPAITVDIDGGAVTEDSDVGVDPDDGVTSNVDDDSIVNFVLEDAGATLTGFVRDSDGNGESASVNVFSQDTSGQYTVFVTGQFSNFTDGGFSMPLTDGTFRVRVDAGSLPPGFGSPDAVTATVEGATITFNSGASTEGSDLILTLEDIEGGITGTILDDSDEPVSALVIVEDALSGDFVAAADADTTGAYSIALAEGTYKVFLDSFSLPQGSVPPAPKEVSITDAEVTVNFVVEAAEVNLEGHVLQALNGFDITTVDCTTIDSEADLEPVSCIVILMIPPADATSPPTFLSEVFTGTDGFFSLPVGEGTYDVVIDPVSLPSDILAPPPISVTVTDGVLTTSGTFELCTDGGNTERRLLFVEQVSVTLQGELVDDVGDPVDGFVMLTNSSDGSFVTGSSTDANGEFELPLGDLTYKLKVDPFSLSIGQIPPPAVTVSVSGADIVVGSAEGVSYDALLTPPMTITVSSASSTVDGTVTDSDDEGVQVEIIAYDSADNFITSTFSNSATGAYELDLAPGIYEIKIDPFSLPAGFSAPASQNANLDDGETQTIDFVLEATAAEITGEVFYLNATPAEVGVSVFVAIHDSVTDDFIDGITTTNDGSGNYTFSLSVGAGSFRLGVDPDSTPPGYLPPPPVNFTVSVNAISGVVTIDEDERTNDTTDDGVMDIELEEAGTQLFGQVRADTGSGFEGTFASVILELADGTGTIIAEKDSTTAGKFDFYLSDGSYNMFVASGSLPQGYVAPPKVLVTVDAGVVSIDGAITTTDAATRYNIDLDISAESLTGNVLDGTDGDAPLQSVLVMQFDADTGAWINDDFTDDLGFYSLPVVDGDFKIEIDSYSLPAGLLAPPPVEISVSGTTVTLPDASTLDLTLDEELDFTLQGPDATVSIDVVNDLGESQFVEIVITDDAGDTLFIEFLDGAARDIGFVAGDYFVKVEQFSLPPGLSAPAPVSLTVNADGTTDDGSGTADDGEITITLQEAAGVVSGTVTFGASNVVSAEIAAVDLVDDLEVATAFTNIDGYYELELPVGDYEISLVDGLPAGAIQPAPFFVYVSDVDQTVDFDLDAASGTVSGTITLDGVGVLAEVLALEYDVTMGEWMEVTNVDSDATDGTYALPVPDGDFVVVAQIDETALTDPTTDLVVAPLPLVTTISADSATVDLDYFIAGGGAAGEPTSLKLSGDVTAGGAPFTAPLLLFHKSGVSPVELPMQRVESAGGTYAFAIREDTTDYQLELQGSELPPDFTAPAPVDLTVDAGSIDDAVGALPSDGAGGFLLDFDVALDGVLIYGVVTDASAAGISGVEVQSFNMDTGTPGSFAFTDGDGNYSMVLPSGNYDLSLTALPAEVVSPPPVEVEITGTAPSFTVTIDGVVAADGNIDWTVSDAHAHLTGQLTITEFGTTNPVSGRIVIYDGTDQIGFVFSSTGNYDVYLPVGDLTIVAELDFHNPNVIVPLPLEVTVADTGSIGELTHDFEFIEPDAANPGQAVNGIVVGDGLELELELVVTTDTGSIVAFIETDMFGFWQIVLGAGNYVISIADDDVPVGYTGPTSVSFEVIDGGIDGGGVLFGNISFVLNTVGNTVSGNITDSSSVNVEGAVLYFLPDVDEAAGPPGADSVPAFAVTDSAGNYSILLPDGDYEIEFDVETVPAGQVVPGIDFVTLAAADLTRDFVLEAADATVSGSFLEDGSPGRGYVYAYDPSTYQEVTFTTSSADGTYTIELPAGDFTLIAEREFDEAGGPPPTMLIQPDPISVTMAGVDLIDQDFDFTDGTGTSFYPMYGQVNDGPMSVAAEVLVLKEVAGEFLMFAIVESLTGGPDGFNVDLTEGTYRFVVIEVDGAATWIGPREITVDSTGNASEGGQPASSLYFDANVFTITGTVTDDTAAAVEGIEIIALDDFSGIMYAAGVTDASGDYELNIPTGMFDVMINPDGLTAIIPPPSEVEIIDNVGTLEATVDGTASAGVIDWVLSAAHATVSGSIIVDGAFLDGTVSAYSGNMVVATTQSVGGSYDLNLPIGDLSIVGIVNELPPGIMIPAPFEVTVEDTGTIEDYAYDVNFIFPSVGEGQTLTGNINADGAPLFDATLRILTASGAFVTEIQTDASGHWEVTLPVGDYVLSILDSDLPVGFTGTSSTFFTITATDVSGGGVFDGNVDFQLDTNGIDVSGTIVDHTDTPLENVVVYFEQFGTPPTALLPGENPLFFAVTNDLGEFSINLLEFTDYDVYLAPQFVPTTSVVPLEVELEVEDVAISGFDFTLVEAEGTMAGHVYVDGLPATGTEILVFDSLTGADVTWAETDAAGDYLVNMPAGDFLVVGEAEDADLSLFLAPDPQEVTIAATDDLVGINFDFVDATTVTTQTLTLRVLDFGATSPAEGEIQKEDAVTADQYNFYVEYYMSDTGGTPELLIALTPGDYQVTVDYMYGDPVTVDPVIISVSATDITVDGVALVGNLLEIDADVGGGGGGGDTANISGTVTDEAVAAVAGATVAAIDMSDDTEAASSITDAAGAYSFDLPVGMYRIEITAGLPADSVTPAMVMTSINDSGGGPPLTIDFDGMPSGDGILDLTVLAAHGSVDGTISLDGVASDGMISVFEGTDLVTRVSAPGGVFDVNMPAGDMVVVAHVDDLASGIIVPNSYQVTVVDTGSVETTTNDFDFVTADAVNPGETLSGLIVIDGVPGVVPLFIFDDTGVIVAVIETDENGDWEVTLAPGNYTVSVSPDAVPAGFTGITSTDVVVVDGAITGNGVDNDEVDFVINTFGADVSGNVTDSVGAAVADAVIFFEYENLSGPSVNAWAVTDASGDYSLNLTPGMWEAWFDPASLPAGEFYPGITEIEVLAVPVTQDFVLVAAAGAIEGTVTVDGVASNDARVVAFDTTTLEPIAYRLVATDGTYSMLVGAGEYMLFAETDLDLSAFVSPGPARVTMVASDVTGIDFDFQDATTTDHQILTVEIIQFAINVSGEVSIFREDDVVADQYDLMFEDGTNFDGTDHNVVIALAPGDYRVIVEEADGMDVTVDPVDLTVSTLDITVGGSALVGNLLTVDVDGGGGGGGTFAISGVVSDETAAFIEGAVITAYNEFDDTVATSDTTDAVGAYSIDLGPGDYYLVVSGLSGTQVAPAECDVSIVDNAGTLEASFDGVPNPTGIKDYVIAEAEGSLTGTVYVDGVATDAWIIVFDGPAVVTESEAPLGVISMNLPAGDLVVLAELDDHPSGIRWPMPFETTVVDSGSVDAVASDFLFVTPDVANPGQTLTGTVTSDGSPWVTEFLISTDLGVPVAFAESDFVDGSFEVTLPPADFTMFTTSPGGIPPGFVGTTTTDFTVTADDLEGYGISDQHIDFVWNLVGTEVSGTITDHTAAALENVVIFFELDDFGGPPPALAWTITDASGFYSITLGTGFHEVWIDDATIPTTSVRPGIVDIDVQGSPVTQDFSLLEAVGTVSGTVSVDGVGTPDGEVLVFDPTDQSEVTFMPVDSDGTYSINMPDGTWTVFAEVDNLDLTLNLIPDPTREIVTTASDITADFDFVDSTTVTTQTLAGAFTNAAGTVDGEFELLKEDDVVADQFDFFAEINTQFDGTDHSYSVALSPGTYDMILTFADGMPITATYEVVVSAADITIDGVLLSGDFDIDIDALGGGGGGPTYAVSGTVTDDAAAAVVAAIVEVRNMDDFTVVDSATTDAAGAYDVEVPLGVYSIELVGGLPVDTVAPVRVVADVTDDAGLEISFDGTPSVDGILDWTVAGAHGSVDGNILTDGVAAEGSIFVFDGTTMVTQGDTTGGAFDVNLPAGSLTVIATLDGGTPGLITPAPYEVTVVDTGSIEATTNDFDFITPDVANPGETLSGHVFEDGMPANASLIVTNDVGVIVAMIRTDSNGEWEITLAPGTYSIALAPEDIPPGYTGVTGTTFTVVDGGITGTGLEGGEVDFVITTLGTTVSGTITDSAAGAVSGAVIFFEFDPPMGDSMLAWAMTDGTGFYSLDLHEGDWEFFVDPYTLPAGEVYLGLTDLMVGATPITNDLTLSAAAGAIEGTVTVDGVATPNLRVVAYDVATFDPLMYRWSESDGTYSLDVTAGDYTVLVESDGDIDLTAFVTPDPQRVTMVAADVTGIDFDFGAVGTTTNQLLTVHLLDEGATVSGEITILKEDAVVVDQFDIHSELHTEFDGTDESIQIALSPGDYQVEVNGANGMDLSMPSIDIVVSAVDITVDATPLPGNLLEIAVDGPIGDPTQLNGVVVYEGSLEASVDVILSPLDGGADTTITSDVDGAFSFTTATDGEYWLTVDPTTVPVGAATPRSQRVRVMAGSFYPYRADIGLPPAIATLDGTVTVDSVPAIGLVSIFDNGMNLITQIVTDGTGAYSLGLPAGNYSVLGLLTTPAGDEVPPILSSFFLTADVTQDIDFDTGAASEVMTGTVAFDGIASGVPVIVYDPTDPPAPVAMVFPDPTDGSYAVRLPYGTFEVILSPGHAPVGAVLGEPVTITVDATGINGTDLDGAAIATNTLDLDPYGASDAGDVRQLVGDLAVAVSNGDPAAVLDPLFHTTALWNGETETEILDWPLEDDWGDMNLSHLIGFVTNIDADTWIVDIKYGRESELTQEGYIEDDHWDARLNDSPQLRLKVIRDSGVDPWEIVGNELHSSQYEIFHILLTEDTGTTTTIDEMEFQVEEADGVNLTSVSVAGTGITDGTLTEHATPYDDQWSAILDDLGGSPAPFDGDIALIVDGGTYTFTVTTDATDVDTIPIVQNNPDPTVLPVVFVSELADGSILMEWDDVSAQMSRSMSAIDVEVFHDDGSGNDITDFERTELALGSKFVIIPADIFSDGTTYVFSVEYRDVGDAGNAYDLEVAFPMP